MGAGEADIACVTPPAAEAKQMLADGADWRFLNELKKELKG